MNLVVGFAWNLACWEIQEIRTPKYAKVFAFNVKELDDGPCFVAMIDVLVFLLKYAQVWGEPGLGPQHVQRLSAGPGFFVSTVKTATWRLDLELAIKRSGSF